MTTGEGKPYRVLTLDGGGARGLYTATKLHTLMKRYLPNAQAADRDIGKAFDMIVGTSTGGILATALALGKSTAEIIKLYADHGKDIFPDPMPPETSYWWAWKNRKSPAGNRSQLQLQLKNLFGDETIGSMYQKRKIGLCVPAVNVATNKAWVFKTAHNPEKHRDDNYKLVDVCLATSAAPIFLPLSLIENPDTGVGEDVFADGGLWANNPVLVGLVEALEMSGKRPIEIISIGTCPPPSGQVVAGNEADRGIMDWKVGIKIVETSIDAQASGHHFMATILANKLTGLGKQCTVIRLPQSPPSSEQVNHLGLDNASAHSIQVLSQLGKSDGEAAHSWSLPGNTPDRVIVKDIFSNLQP